MTRSQLVFKAVDIIMKKPQNAVKYEGITVIKDVAYNEKHGKRTSGDIYFDESLLPEGGKYPIIFNIHGGGFVMGDKSYRECLCSFYAKNGYFVYNINFRMPMETSFNGIIHDCAQALNYLHRLSLEYPIDLGKIVVTGDSSGGFLALYLTAAHCDEGIRVAARAPEITVDIAAVAPLCGMCDLKQIMEKPLPFGLVKDLANIVFEFQTDKRGSNLSSYELYDYINPTDFIDNSCPNAFIAWSERDFICKGQGQSTADILREKNCNVKTYSAPGIHNNHCYHLLFKTKHGKRCMDEMMSFLNEALKNQKSDVKFQGKTQSVSEL